MRSKTFLNASIVTTLSFALGFVFGALYSGYLRPINLYVTGISDEEYIRIAGQTIEVQKFLKKYPSATAYVDRSGALAVDFRIDKYIGLGTNGNYLRLRIFINPRNNRPMTLKFIDCSGKLIRNNLLEYLQTEKCLE